MQQKEGKGILYLTVAITALFVAVISGTFAYLTAATTSNTITGNIANVKLTLSVTKVSNMGTESASLIPISSSDITSAISQDKLSSSKQCVNDEEYTVCQIYKITITTQSTTQKVLLTGKLKLEAESAENIKWELLESQTTRLSTASSVSINVDGYLTSTSGEAVSGTQDYYVVIWLNEATGQQTDTGTFTGTVTFYGNGPNEGQITANF